MRLQEENLELKRRLREIEDRNQQHEQYLNAFIDSFYNELTVAIEQHEMVTEQHHTLGDIVGKIKEKI